MVFALVGDSTISVFFVITPSRRVRGTRAAPIACVIVLGPLSPPSVPAGSGVPVYRLVSLAPPRQEVTAAQHPRLSLRRLNHESPAGQMRDALRRGLYRSAAESKTNG